MKVYIYRKLLNVPSLEAFERQVAAEHRLRQHLTYLRDLTEEMKARETEDPDEADLFFVPIFTIGFQFRNVDPAPLLLQCEHLDRGRHVLLATLDNGQRKKSPWEFHGPGRAYQEIYPWLDERFHLITLESTIESHPNDVGMLPYLSDLEPPARQESPRPFLVSFVGTPSYHPALPREHIRGGRLVELARAFPGRCLIGDLPTANAQTGKVWSTRDYISNSLFTLCPAGFGRWTFRLVEALRLGSIPVLLSDGYVLPFSDTIDWSRYLYRFDERDLPEVIPALEAEPISRVHEKLQNIRRDRHLFEQPTVLRMALESLEATVRRTARSPLRLGA